MSDKINVIIVEPNKEPVIKEIDNTLDELQKIVDGYIEIVNLEDDVDLICNDEGKIRDLPFNRVVNNDVIAGTFIIAGVDYAEGKTISIPKEKVNKYIEKFSLKNHIKKIEYLKKEFIKSGNLAFFRFIPMDKNDKEA